MTQPLTARRGDGIPFSDLRRIYQKAAELEKSGKPIIHFEIGKLNFDTPAHIKSAAARALEQGMVHYTPNAGIPQLREAVAESIQKHKKVNKCSKQRNIRISACNLVMKCGRYKEEERDNEHEKKKTVRKCLELYWSEC